MCKWLFIIWVLTVNLNFTFELEGKTLGIPEIIAGSQDAKVTIDEKNRWISFQKTKLICRISTLKHVTEVFSHNLCNISHNVKDTKKELFWYGNVKLEILSQESAKYQNL